MAFVNPASRFLLLIAIFIIILSLIALFEKYWFRTEYNTPEVKHFGIQMPAGNYVHGIDVSRHQGKINWEKAAAMRSDNIGIRFVFIKATEGITRTDDKFAKNWKASKENKFIRGAYHFYYPSRDAKQQAQNFTRKVKLESGDLPPVIDIEVTNGKSKKNIVEGLKIICDELEKYYTVKPIIYTNLHFYETYLKDDFKKYPLWISCYFDQKRFEEECGHNWKFWQHSDRGKVDGIRGPVDFNVFNGSLNQLNKLRLR